MVSNCANPKCAKPLHYLREGRIFVFNVRDSSVKTSSEKQSHQLEHYWLCGDCSPMFLVEHRSDDIRLVPRLSIRKYVVQKYVVQEKVEEPPCRDGFGIVIETQKA
jgi:hypothetical protein